MKWIQRLVNEHPAVVNDQLAQQLGCCPEDIFWRSPLKGDAFSEYRDRAAVDLIGARLSERSLETFWPNNGPQWDALAVAGPRKNKYIFAEAKSHICEICSSGTGATGESQKLIEASLAITKQFLGSKTRINWSRSYYQYANRLAHLYLLRELNHLDAYMAFIYFLNDAEMGGPRSIEEWITVIELIERSLGIHQHKLSDFTLAVFVDVNNLRDA